MILPLRYIILMKYLQESLLHKLEFLYMFLYTLHYKVWLR
nr:MAG TPA: hypothetical protein [Bacteriophage sp.]